ncbi:hypothetical protein Hypma_000014, partial [Hypsizygus marmoreus]
SASNSFCLSSDLRSLIESTFELLQTYLLHNLQMILSDIAHATAQDLAKNPNLLLHKKGLEGTRTAFDGRVGSVIDNGQYFVISPNMAHVYLPPWGRNRETRVRMDGRFADDDYLVGLQPYLPQFCHYAAIPRQPKYTTDPLSIMWWIPTKKDFVYCSSNVISGLGKLDSAHLALLGQHIFSLQQRVDLFRKDSTFASQKKQPVLSLSTSLDHAYSHLESLPTSFRQVQFGVGLLQRCFLELTAHIDYLYIYHPIMTGQFPPATSVAHTIGAYVFDDVVVQEFVRVGLPVWIVKSFTYLHATRVDAVVSPLPPETWAVLEDAIPPYHPFFTGPATSPEKYHAFGTWARRIVGYPNPFADTAVPRPPAKPSSSSAPPHGSGPIRSKQSSATTSQPYPKKHPKPHAKPHGPAPIVGRNKFLELNSPLSPPPIIAWSYVFPDPGLFIGVTDPQKAARFIHNWLQYRQALIFRLSSGNSSAQPISPQLWRTLLNFGLDSQGMDGLSVKDKRRRELAELLGSCLGEGSIELSETSDSTTFWRERSLEVGALPSEDIIREILWELFELNFRFEFVTLDSRASRLHRNLDERQRSVMACFPGNYGGSLLVAEVSFADKGLAALLWKDRAPYLLAMLNVVKTWDGCPSLLTSIVDKAQWRHSEADVISLENGLARFYTQSFFNFFGRAAIVPHRLNLPTV